MIRIRDLALPPESGMKELTALAARVLGMPVSRLGELTLARQSIDARKKSDVHYVYTVDVDLPDEERVARRSGDPRVELYTPRPYAFPAPRRKDPLPPVVVGMGPAGLFAALFLARAGLAPVVLERGQDVERRTRDVERFWRGEGLDAGSNVQFGEGGAGTFSDGKLTTGTHDERISAVLRTFAEHGAPEDILWSHKPHVGTDVLRGVVKSIRQELLRLGVQVRFGARLCALEAQNGRLSAAVAEMERGRETIPCSSLILAPGHSARDTFEMLAAMGVPMTQKPFAVGVRVEHLQQRISARQYGPAWTKLPPSDYKLACHLPGGRSAFTFCVCPGGQVVAAASGPGEVVTNGMSLRARAGSNINGGLLVGVGPEDLGGSDVLAGVRFQQQWERAAFRLGGGDDRAPVQRVEDFLAGRPSDGPGAILPTYRPGVTWTALDGCLPGFVSCTLRGALPLLDRKLNGFADPDAVLTGVETRSSSPVRILRDETYQSALRGLYPCGEGAGYAGGIVSAAVALNSIVFGTAPHLRQYPSISVIIPGYGVHGTIDGVVDSLIRSFDYCHLDKWEVIVVDDANEVPLVPCDERVKTIRTNHRVYSAGARNIGIIHSRGDIVVFLDGDTYVAPNYIQESIFRNMIVPNLITVCMRESIDEFEQVPNRLPNTTEDTRYKAVYSPERIGSTLVTKPITVMALKETENFKNFGFGRMLGPADLAFMVKGNNICVSRDMANVMFPPGFIGYGPEDVTFSAKLIARGCKVVPVLSSGVFHRKHPLRSGSTRQRDDELRKNIGKQKECLGQNTWEEWINE